MEKMIVRIHEEEPRELRNTSLTCRLSRKGNFGYNNFGRYELAKKRLFCRKEIWDIVVLENWVVSDFSHHTLILTLWLLIFLVFNMLYIKKFNFEDLFQVVGGT